MRLSGALVAAGLAAALPFLSLSSGESWGATPPRIAKADSSFSSSTYQDCSYALVTAAIGGVSTDGGTSVLMVRIDPQQINTTHANPNECAANALVVYRDGKNVEHTKAMSVTGWEPRDKFISQVVSPDGSDMHLVSRKLQTCKLGKCAPWTIWSPPHR